VTDTQMPVLNYKLD